MVSLAAPLTAALACVMLSCSLLVAGLLSMDEPMTPIQTSRDQTPVARLTNGTLSTLPLNSTPRAVMETPRAFVPIETPEMI